jgi:hypothetical protein
MTVTRRRRRDRWLVDETDVKVAGHRTYLYRAIDQHGQVIDVLVCEGRDGGPRTFFSPRADPWSGSGAGRHRPGTVYPRVLDDIVPAARHVLEQPTTPSKLITVGSRHASSEAWAEQDPLGRHRGDDPVNGTPMACHHARARLREVRRQGADFGAGVTTYTALDHRLAS